VRAFFMMGFPDEIMMDIQTSQDYAFSLPAYSLQFEIACPHPETELLTYLREKYKGERIEEKALKSALLMSFLK
jgi:hypothetical protein